MAYSALYRKYRPETFKEIIGQPHITTILQNQIRIGRIAHAYLFSGSRGTGKTSTARIFAKAINCLSNTDGEPCLECEACRAENNVDIIEIDAASNSRVEEMRALIDKAELAPLILKTKVYIIDEAHMLTKNASNALLKTLEEPPTHVVFILATTEPQMLPATIVSRCQRFEFHRLSATNMVASMKHILKEVGASIDDDGLMSIARAAEGGMRDCLSIADQCLSFCGNEVSSDDVLSVLGSVNSGFLFRVAQAIIRSDTASVMHCVDEVVSSGRDIGVFTMDLANHFRALLLVKLCGDGTAILDCTEDMQKQYSQQAAETSSDRAERALEELLKLQSKLRLVTMPRALVESTLLKICRPEDENTLLALSDRINELEAKIKDGIPVNADTSKTSSSVITEKELHIKDDAKRPKYVEVPQPTADADELYERLLEYLNSDSGDRTLYAVIKTSKAHWLDENILHICFDIEGQSSYNYANDGEMRNVLRDAANACISPHSVMLEIRKEGRVKHSGVKKTLLNIPIEEE